MTDVEVHIDLAGNTNSLRLLHRHPGRQGETVTFEYADAWLQAPGRFSIEPALALTRGPFAPARGHAMFGAIGGSPRTHGVGA